MFTRARLGLAVALSLAAIPAALATAADPAPTPGCAGASFVDPAGDAVSNPSGAPGADQPAQPNLDITQGFFLDDGTTTTANIRVVNLDEKVPSGATGIEWYMLFKQGDATNFVHAAITSQGGDATFTYGSIDDRTGVLQDAGDTTGKFFLGKDGVVQIALPGDFATGTLQSPYAQADESVTIPMVGGALSTDDNGPDEMNGTDYTVGPCTTPTPSGGDTGGQPAPQQTQPPPSSGSSTQPAGLTLTVDPRAGSARAVNKRHRVTLALHSNGPVRSLVAILLGKTGKGKALAKGKLAKFTGSGALRLKTGKRTRLKKGRYVVRITGIGPSGQKVTQAFPVALKK